jgi:hypothetical protein
MPAIEQSSQHKISAGNIGRPLLSKPAMPRVSLKIIAWLAASGNPSW